MTALVPVEQKTVVFYDDELTAVLVEDQNGRSVYVPVRPICEAIGITWPGQYERLKRDAVLSDELLSVSVTLTDIDPRSRRPHTSDMLCLPLKFIPGWLFNINANRVKPELRERVIRYQRECYDVLAEAFQVGQLSIEEDNFADILANADPAEVQALHMAQAIVRLARNQLRFSARITGRLDAIEGQTTGRLDEHETRLSTIEEQLNPGRTVTESQAMQISQAIKAVAMELGKRSKRNEYGGVYGELYRRYEINSYKLLPAGKFEDAMQWLNGWLQDTIKDIPF